MFKKISSFGLELWEKKHSANDRYCRSSMGTSGVGRLKLSSARANSSTGLYTLKLVTRLYNFMALTRQFHA